MNDNKLTRREFGSAALGSVAGFTFLQTLVSACGSSAQGDGSANPIIAPKAAEVVKHWAAELQEMSSDLRESRMRPGQWQSQVERLFGRIELPELLRFIDFEKLKKGLEFPDLGVATRNAPFPQLEGFPDNTVFVKKIFGMKKGRAIVPHGHSNMASAHLILNGSFHLRHYEKVSDEGGRLLIRPTIDKEVRAGDSSSISDERDNVHWFVAETDDAFTFDVIMLDLEGKKYDIHNLDIDLAEDAGGGNLAAPKIDVATALRKYGKQHHETGSV